MGAGAAEKRPFGASGTEVVMGGALGPSLVVIEAPDAPPPHAVRFEHWLGPPWWLIDRLRPVLVHHRCAGHFL